MRVYLDERLYELKRDDEVWATQVSVECFTDGIRLEINSSEATLNDADSLALSCAYDFIRMRPLELADDLHKYFVARHDAIQEVGDVWGDDFSGIGSQNDCLNSLEDVVLTVEVDGNVRTEIVLSADCNWQLDGGMRAMFDTEAGRFDFGQPS